MRSKNLTIIGTKNQLQGLGPPQLKLVVEFCFVVSVWRMNVGLRGRFFSDLPEIVGHPSESFNFD